MLKNMENDVWDFKPVNLEQIKETTLMENKEIVTITGDSSKIDFCGCQHKFQDERYGKGKRLFNKTMKDSVYRCTVCGNTK